MRLFSFLLHALFFQNDSTSRDEIVETLELRTSTCAVNGVVLRWVQEGFPDMERGHAKVFCIPHMVM